MKPTETPVFRPTKDCIWNSFRNSGKRHIILTGRRGCGKTTLLQTLCPDKIPGITTWAQPAQAVFLEENLTGRRSRIGVYDETIPGSENKMRLCPEGFETLGLEAIQRCIDHTSEWVSVDEIGYLECGSAVYQDAVRELMAKKRVMAVLRKQELAFLREICEREDVFCVDLDGPYGNTGCVIMASGMGRRFGGNKLMADFHGKPMILRMIDTTEGIFAKRVVVTRHDDVAMLCRERGIEVVLHDLPYRSDTVRLGLQALGETEGCMFCPGDQPLLRRETVSALMLAWSNEKDAIWRAAFEGRPGSPVVFPGWAYDMLLELPEGKGGGHIIKKYPERVRTVPVRDECELMDVDRFEDLNTLLNI